MAASKPAARRSVTAGENLQPPAGVTIRRTQGGQRTWAITVEAEDRSEAAIRAAVVLALELDDELAQARVLNRNSNV